MIDASNRAPLTPAQAERMVLTDLATTLRLHVNLTEAPPECAQAAQSILDRLEKNQPLASHAEIAAAATRR